MSLSCSEMSPADIAACTGNGNNNGNSDGWGGNGAWWIIILFLFVFCGWGGFGFGGGYGNGGGINSPAGQGALTRGDLCMDMNFQEVKREIQNANDAVNLGFSNLNSTICNQQYDTARMINGLQGTVQAGFNTATIAQLQGQNALSTQIAGCCCDAQQTMSAINNNISAQGCDTRYALQTMTRDVIENQNANARAVLDKLSAQELEAKNAQIAEQQQQIFGLQLAASQTAQNQYLVNQLRPCPVPAYITCNPYTASYGVGLANAAGCGCGCNGYAA